MSGITRMLQRLEDAVQSFGAPPPRRAPDASDDDLLAGAVCAVARHYGVEIGLPSLVSGLPLVEGRLPLEYVDAAARRADLAATVDAADPLSLTSVDLPAIVLTQDGGADVLWAIEEDGDPALSQVLVSAPGQAGAPVRLPAADLVAAATGKVIRLRPLARPDERTATGADKDRDGWFLPSFAASGRVYAQAVAATVAINVLALALPLFMMNLYDRVLPNAAAATLWSLAIGVVLATVFDFVIKVLRSSFVDIAGRRADVLLSNLIYSRLIGARLEGAAVSAGVRANTMRELDTLRDFYSSATLTLFGDLPFMLLFMAIIAIVAGWLVVIPLAAVPIVLGIGWVTQRAVGRLMETSLRQTAIKNAVVVETVAGLESIKAAGAESWAAAQWEKATAESIRTGNRLKQSSNLGVFTIHSVQTLTQVVMIVAGFYMAAAGQLTMGALIAATMLAGRAMQPLSQVALLISRLHQMRLSYRLLNEIVRVPQERPEHASFITQHRVGGAISFENVRFRYDKDAAPVLDDVSIAIAPGERIGLVGGIGTGKTTALKLVHGLRQPEAGRILIDGVPVAQIDPAVLRSQIGLLLQEGDLFHGTIRANITLGAPGVTDARLLEAVRVGGALDWIASLPKGLETPVGERGAGLSGGQRQTILLARALLRQPKIVLLDEPTSDLDPVTEQRVVERLRGWLEGRTALIVTHRPALLALVDRLIVLERGRKRLDGPKAAVLAALSGAPAVSVPVKPAPVGKAHGRTP